MTTISYTNLFPNIDFKPDSYYVIKDSPKWVKTGKQIVTDWLEEGLRHEEFEECFLNSYEPLVFETFTGDEFFKALNNPHTKYLEIVYHTLCKHFKGPDNKYQALIHIDNAITELKKYS